MYEYQCPGCGENEVHENCECVKTSEYYEVNDEQYALV